MIHCDVTQGPCACGAWHGDRFAALRGTPEPEELEEHGPEFPDGSDADGFPGGDERFAASGGKRLQELLAFDQAVIEAAKAIGKSRDGKTYCINEPQTIDGQLYYNLDRALVARRVARGEPR